MATITAEYKNLIQLDGKKNLWWIILHSRAPIMSIIYSSPNILSKICGLLSITAREQTYISEMMKTINHNIMDWLTGIKMEWKSVLTYPFDYFENHVKAINIFQVFTNSE